MDKKKARENRKNTPSAWDIKKKKEADEKSKAARKAGRKAAMAKHKKWKCTRGMMGK